MNRSPERWARVAAWFDEVVELPAAQRAARMAQIKRDDPDAAAELQALLDADATADDLLDAGLAAAVPSLPVDGDGDVGIGGVQVGSYRLLHLLGAGGMGAVYLAERSDGTYEQRVALKLIKRGMDSMALMRRFLLERRILARLAHPHIVRLLDGGMSDDGRPYYVMEHVAGSTILAHASARQLDVRQRIALLAQVADAVAYAHAQLIVHRDLKPSNVLVDDGGEPRVLDFGIAKLMEETGEATMTGTGLRVLSPAYAAPEQILGEPIGTATDVYALGLMLCELLTGQLPHRRALTPSAMLARGIDDEAVERPSVLLERSGAVGASAVFGAAVDAATLARSLRGDLDLIVLTALQRDPSRRYPTAAAFADDLRRWLDDRPLLARADTTWYRLRSFVRRHRLGVAATGLILVSLIGGLGAALWQAREARLQASLAEQQSARAERVKGFLISIFQQNDPAQTKGSTLSAVEILRRGRAGLETSLGDDPETLAELLVAISEIQGNLNEYDDAIASVEKAVPLLQSRLQPDDARLGMALFARGQLYSAVDRMADAEPDLTAARAILAHDSAHPERLDAVERELAYVLTRTRTPEAAVALSRTVLGRMQKRLPADSPLLAEHRMSLALLLEDAGDYPAAVREYELGLPVLEKALGPLALKVCDSQKSYGGLLDRVGKADLALVQLQRALDCRRQLYGEKSIGYANVQFSHGILLLGLRRYAEAEADFRSVIDVLDADSNEGAHGQRYLGRALFEQGRHAEAAQHFQQAEAVYRKIDLPNDVQRWRARADYGYALFRNGDASGGRAAIEAALAAMKEVLPAGDSVDYMRPLRALGEVAVAQGDLDAAITAQRHWQSVALKRLGASAREHYDAGLQLATSLLRRGGSDDIAEAKSVIDAAVTAARAASDKHLDNYERALQAVDAALAKSPAG